MAEPTTQSQPARPASAGMVGFSAGALISLGASSSSVLDSVLDDEDMIFFQRELSCARAGERENCKPKGKERRWEVVNIYTYGRGEYVGDDVFMEAVRKGEGEKWSLFVIGHVYSYHECQHLSVGRYHSLAADTRGDHR